MGDGQLPFVYCVVEPAARIVPEEGPEETFVRNEEREFLVEVRSRLDEIIPFLQSFL
jgi:hypothetical protein